jgi:hypothetical protein
MTTLNLTSTSQVEALVMGIQDWHMYIYLTDSILRSRPEAGIAAFALNGVLLQKRPVVMLLHRMIKQELTEDAARTFPAVLGNVYPWNEDSVEPQRRECPPARRGIFAETSHCARGGRTGYLLE